MDRHQKRQLKDIAKHKKYEEMKARKEVAKLRRATKGEPDTRPSRVTEENWDDLTAQKPRTSKADLRAAQSAATPASLPDDAIAAIVISVASGRCRAVLDGKELDCIIPQEIAVHQKSALTVGDRVAVEEDGGLWHVTGVLPRRSVLARPDPLNKNVQRLVAANIDVVIHVVSVKAPPLRPRLIDRYLIAIQRGGASAVICVNKIDLLDDDERASQLAQLETYRDLGVPVIGCSTKTGEGLDELRAEVQGKTAALVGHSGVGKSSILNALDSRLELATKTLHRRGTGRHTTTSSTLFDFGDGTYLIDTPGIREFGLWDLDRSSLREYFPEFEAPAQYCRFNDCVHVHEPDCAVKEKVEAGDINRARYDTYLRLYEDLAQ
jgi:ribosome biogenesis GTPase